MNRFIVCILSLLVVFPVLAAEPDDESLYSVPFKWKNQVGADFSLGSLRGAPVVLTLAYTRCATACPMTMQRIKKVAAALSVDLPQAQFVIVSLDPANDTPETLEEFRIRHKLNDSKWHLLTGSDTDVRKLSVLLNYSYQQQAEDNEIAHSNKIVALTPQGQIGTEVDGLDSDLAPFVAKVKKFSP